MKKLSLYILLLIMGLNYSCKEQKNQKPVNNEELREQLIKANQIMTRNEAEEINNYIKRYELNLEKSGSGLRYHIKEKGKENSPGEDDAVTIDYKVHLLDGTKIEDNNSGSLHFIMGRAEAPKGLEEGLSMIGEGGEIYLIIPSHLAYGRTGNETTVPGNTPIVVNVKLINVKKN